MNPDNREVSLDELFDMRGSDASQVESRDRFTIRSGVYQFQGEGYKVIEVAASDRGPARIMIYLNGKVQNNGKASKFSFSCSPTEVRNANNRLDGKSKLYLQLLTTMDLKASQHSPKDAVEAALRYPMMLKVRESFLLDDGTWANATGDGDSYGVKLADGTTLTAGQARARYQAVNFVDSIYKVKN